MPRAAVTEVALALRRWIDSHDVALPSRVEIRFIGADDIWLSTAFERDNAHFAFTSTTAWTTWACSRPSRR